MGFGLIVALLSALLAIGCSDSDSNNNDKKDSGSNTTADSQGTATADGGGTVGKQTLQLVLNRILVPSTPEQITQFGVDFDGNNTIDNTLGAILGTVGQLDLQSTVDDSVNGGSTILLLEVKADNFTSDPSVNAQAWVGKKPEKGCCPDPDDSNACKKAADESCFKGDFSFDIAADSPADSTLTGQITGGKLSLGPGELTLKLPLSTSGALTLPLKFARITGQMSADGISDGVLAGVISKTELDSNVIPAVASLLDTTINNADVSKETKDTIKNLFDDNTDGKITADEVKDNKLLKTLFEGDFDLDNDKTKEISLGIGFTAVKATIVPAS